ncbi:MAG: hypothetical protein WCD53_19790 [Microcoleus sp.]
MACRDKNAVICYTEVNAPRVSENYWHGRPVVPLILRDLEQKPDHWFWALRAITGDNPVKSEQRGRMKLMAQAWIQWGKENGYEW